MKGMKRRIRAWHQGPRHPHSRGEGGALEWAVVLPGDLDGCKQYRNCSGCNHGLGKPPRGDYAVAAVLATHAAGEARGELLESGREQLQLLRHSRAVM